MSMLNSLLKRVIIFRILSQTMNYKNKLVLHYENSVNRVFFNKYTTNSSILFAVRDDNLVDKLCT